MDEQSSQNSQSALLVAVEEEIEDKKKKEAEVATFINLVEVEKLQQNVDTLKAVAERAKEDEVVLESPIANGKHTSKRLFQEHDSEKMAIRYKFYLRYVTDYFNNRIL